MEYELNRDQQAAFDAVRRGFNVFITGGGGVGKSVLIRAMQKEFGRTAVFCAPTGIAALNIGGATLHRTFFLPFSVAMKQDWEDVHPKTKELFYDDTVKTLVIDEISMVRADMLTTIDYNLRRIKRNFKQPFGGIQIVFVGDFFQLPPVLTPRDSEAYYSLYASPYAFDCDTWDESELQVFELEQVMRQSEQNTIRALNAIRKGSKSQAVLNWLNKQCETSVVRDDAVTLCPTNSAAWDINSAQYDALDTDEEKFFGKTTGEFRDNEKPVDDVLKLKAGARVILCANNAQGGYMNGQSGTVVDFIDTTEVIVDLDDGSRVLVEQHEWEVYDYKKVGGQLKRAVIGTFKQFPLKLGWAITVHKSQGMTFDECRIDLGRGAFCHGQTYVALSRIRSLDGLKLLRDVYDDDIIVDEEVIEFYDYLKEQKK